MITNTYNDDQVLSVSVITPVRNGQKTISRCIESVLGQEGVKVEHILVDALSTDRSLEIVQSFKDERLRFVSEADSGIYSGMNKGIQLSKNEWILFLGADDYLFDSQSLQKVFRACQPLGNAKLLLSDIVYDNGRRFVSRLSSRMIFRTTVHHQGCLYHRSLFTQRQYDEAWRICGDYEFNLSLLKQGIQTRECREILCLCGSEGRSSEGKIGHYLEEISIRHQYFPSLVCLPFDVTSFARFVMKQHKVRRLKSLRKKTEHVADRTDSQSTRV